MLQLSIGVHLPRAAGGMMLCGCFVKMCCSSACVWHLMLQQVRQVAVLVCLSKPGHVAVQVRLLLFGQNRVLCKRLCTSREHGSQEFIACLASAIVLYLPMYWGFIYHDSVLLTAGRATLCACVTGSHCCCRCVSWWRCAHSVPLCACVSAAAWVAAAFSTVYSAELQAGCARFVYGAACVE
jgi:hypothetical protein